MEFITGVYLFFIFVSLYSVFLVLLIYLRNKDKLYFEKEARKFYDISVVIPAYNKEDSIVDTVNAVRNIDYPKDKIEIIVVDDGSKDKTAEIARNIDGIRFFEKSYNSGKSDSVNFGIRNARGEIIAVIDADSYPEKDSFKKMIGYFDDPDVGAVTASCFVRNTGKLIEKLQAVEYFLIAFGRKILDFVDSVYVTPGSLSMYRKKILVELGGFDTKNITEDIEIAWKILKNKYKNRMCLSAKVYTDVPDTLRKWWRQRLRWNIGGFQTVHKYRDSFFKKKLNMFGLFVVPRFFISHVLSITGFFVFVYVFGREIFQKVTYWIFSIQNGNTILEAPSLFLIPSVFTFFILLLFAFTLVFTYIGLKTMNKINIGFKANFITLFYLLFYLTLYPLVLLHSLYLLAAGNIRW